MPSGSLGLQQHISDVWEQEPDLRLAQRILIACQHKTAAWPDEFSVEDEALLEGPEEYRAQLEGASSGQSDVGNDGCK